MSKFQPPVRKINEADVYPTPDMSIVADHKHPASDLPLEAFGAWAEWITHAAESKCAPPDYVGLALLCAASSMIANVRQGSPWEGWAEPPLLWGALVGVPSTNKSPALEVIREPFRRIEGELAEDYAETVKKYEDDTSAAEMRFEQWKATSKKALKAGDDPPPMPDDARKPICPPRPRLCINDITIEKAAEVAMENPRGLCLCRDELAGLLANMERHGGSDREFYLEAYGGRRYTVDRKKHPDPIIIPRLSIAILGTIQPEKLSTLLTDSVDDGLAARFLFAWPEPVAFKEPKRVHDEGKLLQAFWKLRELPFAEEKPRVVSFSKAAKALFLEWREALPEKEEKEYGVLVSFLGKLPGVIIRLAMTLAYLDWSVSDNEPEPTSLSEEIVGRAIMLVDDYFMPMGKRALGEYAVPQRQMDARIIARWILHGERDTVNIRDMKRRRVLPTNDAQRYDSAIAFLEQSDWLIKDDERDGPVGRRPKRYRVNPRVFNAKR